MAGLTPDRLRKWADELEAEDKAELEAAERKRIEELAARPALDEDDVKWLREMRADFENWRSSQPADKPDPAASGGDKPAPAPDDKPPPERRTRPGRKTGQAYDWDVDEQGKVTKIGVATIYSGEDEPDEVEIETAAA